MKCPIFLWLFFFLHTFLPEGIVSGLWNFARSFKGDFLVFFFALGAFMSTAQLQLKELNYCILTYPCQGARTPISASRILSSLLLRRILFSQKGLWNFALTFKSQTKIRFGLDPPSPLGGLFLVLFYSNNHKTVATMLLWQPTQFILSNNFSIRLSHHLQWSPTQPKRWFSVLPGIIKCLLNLSQLTAQPPCVRCLSKCHRSYF